MTPILVTPEPAAAAAPALAPAPPPLPPKVLAACLLARGDTAPDASAEGRSIRGAWRDLNCKQNGDESYRRRLPAGEKAWRWVADERLPRVSMYASDRRATVHGDVYPGDLVATFTRAISHGASTGKAKLDGVELYAGVNADDKPILVACPVKRRRDGQIAVVLPNGSTLVCANPDW